MKIVIKIPNNVYKALTQTEMRSSKTLLGILVNAIKNGTPLPKGHGRLCDLDAALECIEEGEESKEKFYAKCLFDWACSKRVVIEADKTESEE